MGSMTGSPGDYEEMLHFCSKFEINPTIELFQMKEINFALDKVSQYKILWVVFLFFTFLLLQLLMCSVQVRANKIRYRAVLQMEGEQ
jgi:hypothetical protein